MGLVRGLGVAGANAVAAQDGPFKEFHEAFLGRGQPEEMAKLTLARKIAAIVLRLWRTEETFEATKLKMQTT